jgi:hypothetical protein
MGEILDSHAYGHLRSNWDFIASRKPDVVVDVILFAVSYSIAMNIREIRFSIATEIL